NRGLMLRIFGELADPPDGSADPAVRVRDVLRARLRSRAACVRRRMRIAARRRSGCSLTGEAVPAELPVLAGAVAEGAVGEEHVREVCRAMDWLPSCVAAAERAKVEQLLVEQARAQDPEFVAAMGRRLADTFNPDGIFDE